MSSSSTSDQELATAQQTALSEFATTLALLDAVPTDAAGAEAQKRLKRARMLHNVLTAKFPAVKLDDLAKMGAEWLHGMLDASYPAETALVDGGCADVEARDALLRVLDGAHEWVRRLVGVFALGGRLQPPPPSTGSSSTSSDAADATTSQSHHACKPDAAEAIRQALASGATLHEVVGPGAAAEGEVLGGKDGGVELWEALCWRRGALRYYTVSSAVGGGKAEGNGGKKKASAKSVGRAAAPCAALIDDAVAALRLLLHARGGVDDDANANANVAAAPPPPVKAGSALTLNYGIYSDTHLLALAFVGELCYWRWAGLVATTAAATAAAGPATDGGGGADGVSGGDGAGSEGGAVGGGAAGTAAPAPQAATATATAEASATAEADAEAWFAQAAVALHRYLLTVTVLMEGCGWATERAGELLRLLGGARPAALRAALQREAGVEERERACDDAAGGDRHVAVPAAAGALGGDAKAGASKKSNKKKGR